MWLSVGDMWSGREAGLADLEGLVLWGTPAQGHSQCPLLSQR